MRLDTGVGVYKIVTRGKTQAGGVVGGAAAHDRSSGLISYLALRGGTANISGSPVLTNDSRAGGLHAAISLTTQEYLVGTMAGGVALVDCSND